MHVGRGKTIAICIAAAVFMAISCSTQSERADRSPATPTSEVTPAARRLPAVDLEQGGMGTSRPAELFASQPTSTPIDQPLSQPTSQPPNTEVDEEQTAEAITPTLALSPTPTLPPRPTHTPSPPPTATPPPSPTPVPPSPTPTVPPPTATPTPQPTLRRVTAGGCCTQPSWSPDSRKVLFIDKPGSDMPVGIWGVDVTQPEATPQLVTERIGYYTADMALIIELHEDATIIERIADGTRWSVPAGGRPISISPNRKRIAWQVTDYDLPFERRITEVWIANLDGTDAQRIATISRGRLSGWITDDLLLLSGRESLESREYVLYTLSLSDGQVTELVRAERLRGGLLSPDGAWLVYYVALDDDPAENGPWLVRSDGSERRKLGRELFGAYQWRDARRLLIIPFRPQATSHELWEFNVDTGQARRLTDPAVIPFKIANGDWTVSPDGRHVAFVESQDRNIWVITLP